ncbi:MAG TPA: FAD-dependent oxidoreductase, partial [Thermoanaerobaculia bacterium]|nr:FAD-dependent oxidoreductase [Thermoanaerobaculia bacterium]
LVGETLGRDRFTPVTAACLDLALSRLPRPKTTFALGIDRPVYFSVHSAAAQLAPKGGALVHVVKYRQSPGDLRDMEIDTIGKAPAAGGETERELEAVLDEVQPGWRDVVVHRRYLPSMTVSHSLHMPQAVRPSPRSPVAGLYLAGDWVGGTGMLSDAALASARAAARAIITDRPL